MSLRSQQYAGDYDAFESVPPSSVSSLTHRFKQIVKNLRGLPNTYVGDIKCGVIDEWDVVGDPRTRDVTKSKAKLDALRRDNVITQTEKETAEKALKGPYPEKEIKFHILRWTTNDIERGYVEYRGRKVTLGDALQTDGLCKVDVVSLVQNSRYTDFSCVYEFHYPEGKVMNEVEYDVVWFLKRDIGYYASQGQWVKVMKRQFALAKFLHNEKVLHYLQPILTGDLGRLYQIVGDLGTMITLMENKKGDTKRIRYEIDQMIGRLSNIYQLPSYLKAEWDVLGSIKTALKSPNMLSHVVRLHDTLEMLMNKTAKTFVRSSDLKGRAA